MLSEVHPQQIYGEPLEPVDYFLFYEPTLVAHRNIIQMAFAHAQGSYSNLQSCVSEVRDLIKSEDRNTLSDLTRELWAFGYAEAAVIITLAALPTQIATMSTRHLVRFAWPFIDLNCQSIADRFPLCDTLKGPQTGEIWFSWAVWSESWTILERCADLAPSYVSDHLRYLATAAEFGGKSFTEVEEGFDYGRMITPWNHFHLMWLARHLHDDQSALEHARRLCSTTRVGEIRTGRFINRILHWPAFRDIRQALGDDIESARLQLRLTTTEASLGFARNIAEFWRLRGE